MKKAIYFYTTILDFKLAVEGYTDEDWVVLLSNRDAELMLTILEGDQKIGIAANVVVDDVDTLFQKYLSRGLDISKKKNSPVHSGPVEQSWGTREFYVSDDDGNTLRFCRR